MQHPTLAPISSTHIQNSPRRCERSFECPTRTNETVPEPRKEDNPLGAYRLTPENIRHKDAEQLEAERRASLEARRERFREIYTALGISVVVHKDRSLEIRWNGSCPEWHKGTFGCCTVRASYESRLCG
jgi:hypothetical protein